MRGLKEADFGAWNYFCAVNSLSGAMVVRFLSSEDSNFNGQLLEDINEFYGLSLDDDSIRKVLTNLSSSDWCKLIAPVMIAKTEMQKGGDNYFDSLEYNKLAKRYELNVRIVDNVRSNIKAQLIQKYSSNENPQEFNHFKEFYINKFLRILSAAVTEISPSTSDNKKKSYILSKLRPLNEINDITGLLDFELKNNEFEDEMIPNINFNVLLPYLGDVKKDYLDNVFKSQRATRALSYDCSLIANELMERMDESVLNESFLFIPNMYKKFSKKFPGVGEKESLEALFKKIHMQSIGENGNIDRQKIIDLLERSLEKILLNKEDANFIRGSDQNTEVVNQMFEDDKCSGLTEKGCKEVYHLSNEDGAHFIALLNDSESSQFNDGQKQTSLLSKGQETSLTDQDLLNGITKDNQKKIKLNDTMAQILISRKELNGRMIAQLLLAIKMSEQEQSADSSIPTSATGGKPVSQSIDSGGPPLRSSHVETATIGSRPDVNKFVAPQHAQPKTHGLKQKVEKQFRRFYIPDDQQDPHITYENMGTSNLLLKVDNSQSKIIAKAIEQYAMANPGGPIWVSNAKDPDEVLKQLKGKNLGANLHFNASTKLSDSAKELLEAINNNKTRGPSYRQT